MSEKEVSDLSMSRVECSVCGALWINGQHYWATGRLGNELDLAGLVCANLPSTSCLNPKKEVTGGDTWEKRRKHINMLQDEMKEQ